MMVTSANHPVRAHGFQYPSKPAVGRLQVFDLQGGYFIYSRNTNAPTIMIAERAADLIKAG
ncbi:hypothetical protein [Aerolutibacter ruishenii]|uniref:hypothetical protein n=1 Tax=Aerolutibacter ruishenii TaxID=686800 RepID=UPI0011A141F9|nr:hypothetical protein [Lysobacter ruishenii]